MNKKVLLVLLLIFLAVFGLTLLSKIYFKFWPWEYQREKFSASKILFKKQESWGPCPSETEPCKQTTTLFRSGKLIYEGQFNDASQLHNDILERMIDEIHKTGVLNKDCSAPRVMDYSATYEISVDSSSKIITFPGCSQEMGKIENHIPAPKVPKKGGV